MPVSYTRLVRTKEHFFNYRERLNLQTLAKKRPTLIATGVYRVDDTYQLHFVPSVQHPSKENSKRTENQSSCFNKRIFSFINKN